jgi:hypothetical protein
VSAAPDGWALTEGAGHLELLEERLRVLAERVGRLEVLDELDEVCPDPGVDLEDLQQRLERLEDLVVDENLDRRLLLLEIELAKLRQAAAS